MIEELKRYWWWYILEVVGAIIINSIFGIVGLIIYCFIVILLNLAYYIDFLRGLIRVFQVGNEAKIVTIMRKLKITDKEMGDIAEEIKGKSTEKQWASLEKDIKDLRD